MPRLYRLRDGEVVEDRANLPFAMLADDEAAPALGGVIVSLARYRAQGAALAGEGRAVGVRLASDQAVEDLAPDLPALAVVALEFPKFRDGRSLTAAALLRQRFGYGGEVRAVGDVLVDQAYVMVRCGVDAFEPADGSSPEAWARSARRYHHVYQACADGRPPAFVERASACVVQSSIGRG